MKLGYTAPTHSLADVDGVLSAIVSLPVGKTKKCGKLVCWDVCRY